MTLYFLPCTIESEVFGAQQLGTHMKSGIFRSHLGFASSLGWRTTRWEGDPSCDHRLFGDTNAKAYKSAIVDKRAKDYSLIGTQTTGGGEGEG